ncbi:hypothetical protein BFJ72_g12629 [Fusarium proliferatum]|uniref:UbiA prenyltransferase n=1 Tax=Gibberella intermedia TaxID=948311 RepID=A0A420SG04_GIBIN|nr:hypothetical protein BFJ72_g12629 [Fusarium proliferatum]
MFSSQQETLSIPPQIKWSTLRQRQYVKDRIIQRQEISLHLWQLLQLVVYHAYSIWLFTFNDLKTIIGPSILFALGTSPALSKFGMQDAALADLIPRAPLALLWLWINLLPFTIDNQRHPGSISEDQINKPWRTMPSKRMTPHQARNLVVVLYALAIITSYYIGGLEPCLSLVLLGVWYNDFQGAEGLLSRHLLNSLGYRCFNTGALQVVLGSRGIHSPSTSLLAWEAIVSGIVFTTIHAMDMHDQEGDASRNRKTVPLVVGDNLGRFSIAFFMTIWSIVCPAYVGAPPISSAIIWGLGGLVSARYLVFRTVAQDKKTSKLWNLFMVGIYLLPLCGG